jgi:release factor glutamine methyltransferase
VTPTFVEALVAGRDRLGSAGVALPELEAQVLLAHAAGTDRAGLLARRTDQLAEEAQVRFADLLEQRARRVPLAYLTGEREFWSLRLAVDPRVLIPRPDTETLVEAACARAPERARVVDIGTGSGAVAIALARELPAAEVWATDCSSAALAVAGANAAAHGLSGRIVFREGDLLGPLAGEEGRFDLIVSNPPYIPSGAIAGLEPDVREHEPRCALDGGPDGLRVVSRLLEAAPLYLRRGAWLCVEIGAGQDGAVRALAARQGCWARVETAPDLAGIARVIALRAA